MYKLFGPIFRVLLLFIVSGLSGNVSAQPDTSAKIPLDPAVKTGILENGLRYYIRQNKKPEQKVELRLVLNAGSICEDDDQQGLAHMAEHMAFNGTTHFKKNEIVSFLQDIGVGFGNDLNAYTSFDETVYILPIPTDKPGNLEKGFQVLEDWAHNVTYLPEDIDGERPIILEESRLGKGANDRMYRKIYPRLLEGSRYARRLPIGQDSIIKNFPYEAIRRFYRDWYRPDLMAVVVVGDIEPGQAEEMVRKHFTSLKNPKPERPREYAEVEPYRNSEAMVVTDKEATGYAISINYGFSKSHPSLSIGDYRNDLIKSMFTSLLNQRLQEQTQKENPPFLGASVSIGGFARGYESLSAFAFAGNGNIDTAFTALMQEIERVKRFGFTAAELDRVRKSRMAFFERAYNDRNKTESESYVREYVNYFLVQEPSPGIEKEFEYVKSFLPGIRLEEVNDLAKGFKEPEKHFVYVTGPEPKDNAKLPTDAGLLAIVEDVVKADIKPYQEKSIATSLLAALPPAGKVISKSRNPKLGTTELVLDNGIRVTLKQTDFKNDQILMSAGRYGGFSNYGLKDKYNATYAAQVVSTMGIGNFTPTDLRKALAGKIASANPVFTLTSEGLSGSSNVKDAETMFQLAYLYMTSPRKDTALFKSFIQRNKSQFAMLGANPQASFIDTMYQILYNHNPLAPVAVPHSDYFDQINVNRALAIYRERFGNASGMHFTFIGSFSDSLLIPLIERYVASLPTLPKKFNYVDNKVRPVSGIKNFTFRKGKDQKSLILSFSTGEIPYSQDLELKAEVLSEILNIRIIEELREKIQGIYGGGTFAQVEKEPYPNFNFIVQLPCGPEKADTLVKAIQSEFAIMMAKGPAASYLDKVKKQLLEQYKVSSRENETWLRVLQDVAEKGDDPSYFLDYEKKLSQITARDIQATAQKLLGGRNRFTAILMPESSEDQKDKKKGF